MQLHRVPAAVALAACCSLGAAEAQTQPTPPDGAASAPAQPRRPATRPATRPADDQGKAQLDRVEVEGRASDESVRRASTASKIVITREEIERYGDSTIGEVIKRLPGVTTGGRPGRGGDIRMRGMGGGYTQILVNGERMPPGFSVDQLPPDQIERIEVLRAPTAEYGARAIAGTINIVLREALQKRVNDLRLQLSEERGKLRPNLGWTRNDKFGQTGAYNITLNATRNERIDDYNSTSTTHLLGSGQDSTIVNRGRSNSGNESLNVNGRVQWREANGDSFALQPFIVVNRSSGSNAFDQTQSLCSADPTSQIRCLNYDHADTESRNRSTMGRLHGQWQHKLGDDTRLEVRGAFGSMTAHGTSDREERRGGALFRTQDDTTDSRHGSWSMTAKLSHQMASEHSLVGGLEAEGQNLDQTRVTLQNGLPLPALQDFGDNLSASTKRFAYYAQDEWSVGKQWSFYAGLRGETITTGSSSAGNPVSNRSSVWTPLLHAVWKVGENSRDQVRASLTRSYRSPNLSDLIARPSINSQYACPDNALCGANVINYPDRMGNPDLKPEVARGLELAYENYLSLGGIVSVNAFYRRIQDLIRVEPELETVSWASVPRWVARPRNIGDATTYGVELEAKFRLDQFLTDAWPVNIRSNLSLFRSRVEQIPGPHNTLDQQPRGTANLGFDYRLRSLPLTLGANVNYTPAYEIQQTELQLTNLDKKRVADAFALWTFSPSLAVRLSAANLAPLDYFTGSVITTDKAVITARSGGPSYTQWQLRWEIKI
ncbi:TonB-dependent receptor plug domain-containing protein [Roseateles sp.]|uniref:TonB-dependent receptor plug domain-containing protein n=1 Tax=Roseateles sp. TaxID=1971397 RepID=UPI003BA856FF